jgi:hypothetical protein
MRMITAALVVGLGPTVARADYMKASAYSDAQTQTGGTVLIESYDGVGAGGGGLAAGQIRLTVDIGDWRPPYPGAVGGVQNFFFSTNLSLKVGFAHFRPDLAAKKCRPARKCATELTFQGIPLPK